MAGRAFLAVTAWLLAIGFAAGAVAGLFAGFAETLERLHG